jgi:hypothetical protein
VAKLSKTRTKNATSATTCSGKLSEQPENFVDYSAEFAGGVEGRMIRFSMLVLT